ncbi:unnamed protein product, partial [Mesorhabditis belari]|uniref:HIG1 domain-containing protein n=1 Tax=Mesorhabditis belari TaxID=2138241 RepID=A0AAF3FLE5_9BILA
MLRLVFHKILIQAAQEPQESVETHSEPKKGSYEWKKAHLTPEQLARTPDNSAKYSGVPQIPVDIGYRSSKDTAGKKESGVTAHAISNPAVIIGMGLTTMALIGMFKKSIKGDRLGAQKYMQYRIMAQFFTVTALVAGVTIFASTPEKEKN